MLRRSLEMKPFERIQPLRLRFWKAQYTRYDEENLPDIEQRYECSSLLLQQYEHMAFLTEQLRSMYTRLLHDVQALVISNPTMTQEDVVIYVNNVCEDHNGAVGGIIQYMSEFEPAMPHQAVLGSFVTGRILGTIVVAAYGKSAEPPNNILLTNYSVDD